jgi:hypothetical protein
LFAFGSSSSANFFSNFSQAKHQLETFKLSERDTYFPLVAS